MTKNTDMATSLESIPYISADAAARFLQMIASDDDCQITKGKEIHLSERTEEEIIFENGYGMAFLGAEEAALYPNTDSAILLEQELEGAGTRYLLVPMKDGEKQKPVYAFHWDENGEAVEIGISLADVLPVRPQEHLAEVGGDEKLKEAAKPHEEKVETAARKYVKVAAGKEKVQ